MRHIVVDKSGLVVNSIIADKGFKLDGLEVVPHDTGAIGDTWDGVKLTPKTPDPVTIAQVNAEAQRRIFEVMPQHKQANTTAQAAVLAAKGSTNWTPAEIEAWNAGLTEYMAITRLRAHSDNLNLMDPVPQDYADDKWWS